MATPSAEEREHWRKCTDRWFPDLLTENYFIPPIFFRNQPMHLEDVSGNQSVRVLDRAKKTKGQAKMKVDTKASISGQAQPHVATRVYTQPPRRYKKLEVDSSSEQGASAEEHFFHCLDILVNRPSRKKPEEPWGKKNGPMMILSGISYGRHPNKSSYAATAVSFGMSEDLFTEEDEKGECDFLIISRQYGIIVCEVKSVGAYETDGCDFETGLNKKVQQAINQLNKTQKTLSKLAKRVGLPQINIIKTIVLPFVTPEKLKTVCSSDVKGELCKCFGVTSDDEAFRRCLCLGGHFQDCSVENSCHVPDDLVPELERWWDSISASGPDKRMTDDTYKYLVSITYNCFRYCGPATTMELAMAAPHSVGPRTRATSVESCGMIISQLTLLPEQIRLVRKAVDQRYRKVLLTGPPGTGKTVILALVGLEWMREGHSVYVLSTNKASRAVSFLLEEQLKVSFKECTTGAADLKQDGPKVLHRHFNFNDSAKRGSQEVKEAISFLTEQAAKEKELFILMDDAGLPPKSKSYKIYVANRKTFCKEISKIKNVRLWASSMYWITSAGEDKDTDNVATGDLEKIFMVRKLTVPLRCPPVLTREVQKSIHIGDSSLKYESSPSRFFSDGPPPIIIRHKSSRKKKSKRSQPSQPGHDYVTHPKDCEKCGQLIAEELTKLLGDRGDDAWPRLQYRDVFVLLADQKELSDDLPLVKGLTQGLTQGLMQGLKQGLIEGLTQGLKQGLIEGLTQGLAQGLTRGLMQGLTHCEVPVKVLPKKKATPEDYRSLGLALENKVIVTHWQVVTGLERRIVVIVGGTQKDTSISKPYIRVHGISRCTAQLIGIDLPSHTQG